MKRIVDFKEHIVAAEMPLLDAMDRLENVSYKTIFLVDGENVLKGSLTDGDIRRFILARGNLSATALEVACKTPRFVTEKTRGDVERMMKQKNIALIPLVDEEGHILEMLADGPEEVLCAEKFDLPVVIMAGGIGSRLYPYTKILPKPLIPIGDLPIVERIIDFFRKQGCRRFYMIVNYKKNMIKAYFNEIEKDYELTFIDEEVPLGTGGGLSLLKGMLKEPFILTNCDNIINIDFSRAIERHRAAKNLVTVIASVQKIVIPYGVIYTKEDGYIDYMEEKPVLPHLINTGCYIVEPEVVEELEENRNVGFPTLVTEQNEKGRNVGIFPISSETFLDMGQFDQMEHMKQVLHIKD